MKTKKALSLLLSAAVLLLCAACGAENTVTEDGAAVSFTDMTGTVINMDAPASSIVALTAADCEIVYALGAGDLLVGRGEYCDYPAEISSVPAVNSGKETNLEQIIALSPDVVVMADMEQTQEQVDALNAAGITVVRSDAQDIEGVYESIYMLGTLLGKNQEADSLVTYMKDTFAQAQTQAAASDGKTIYFEVSPLQYGLWTAGTDTFMNEIAEMMGMKNIFADVSGWAEISEEQVIDRDPDVIVTISMDFGDISPIEEICARPGWQDISAVKSGAVINLPDNELTRPGPRLASGAAMLCDAIFGSQSPQQ